MFYQVLYPVYTHKKNDIKYRISSKSINIPLQDLINTPIAKLHDNVIVSHVNGLPIAYNTGRKAPTPIFEPAATTSL